MVAIDILPQTALLTADEYLKLPDDDRRTELIDGEILDMPPSSAQNTVSLTQT